MLRVLFFVEGFTDVRFVRGLAGVCRLTLAVPRVIYRESRLKARLEELGLQLEVAEIPGGRWPWQWRSLRWLWRNADRFDVILAQEMGRGALNAALVGKAKGVPVVPFLATSPREYFHCRRERGEVGALKGFVGEWVIESLLRVNGRISRGVVALGPYLTEVARRYASEVWEGTYYGVDTCIYRPATAEAERMELRRRLKLPEGSFLVLSASRLSHEKDPETVIRAVGRLRSEGLDVRLLNLSGEWGSFVPLARKLGYADAETWAEARPPAHPMGELADFYRAADVVAQASLAEGLGLVPLEALACGVPVVATAVGGLAGLSPHAWLVERGDSGAMARALAEIRRDPRGARERALLGREFVCARWDADRGFARMATTLGAAVSSSSR